MMYLKAHGISWILTIDLGSQSCENQMHWIFMHFGMIETSFWILEWALFYLCVLNVLFIYEEAGYLFSYLPKPS